MMTTRGGGTSKTSDHQTAVVRPPLQRSDDVDNPKPDRKMQRGFSRSQGNEELVSEGRSRLLDDIHESNEANAPFLGDTSEFTFLLPNLTHHAMDLRAFLEKDLIEMSSLVSLEQTGRLNWWSDLGFLQRLWPLATSGDGNCLLHAASLGMWGFHDRLLILRHALHHRQSSHAIQFYRRWRWQASLEHREHGFSLSETEWAGEWASLLGLSTPSPKGSPTETGRCCSTFTKSGLIERLPATAVSEAPLQPPEMTSLHVKFEHKAPGSPRCQRDCRDDHNLPPLNLEAAVKATSSETYESLEQIHVFVLAHVIRRPIVVVADRMLRDVHGQPIQPVPFGGVYLPLLEAPEVCHKDPLVLAYVNSHFSALVPMEQGREEEASTESELPRGIPLIDPETLTLLPVHFAVDPGDHWRWGKDDDDSKKIKKQLLDEEGQRRLLERYLRLLKIPAVQHGHAGSNSSLGESMGSSSSYEENESPAASIGQKKSKSKSAGTSLLMPNNGPTAQGMSVANKVGSLGRNIGKQLKKALKGGGGERRKSLCGVNTQTTSQVLTWERLSERGHILCAMTEARPPPRYNDMIENYLKGAGKRFSDVDLLHRRRSVEIVKLAQERRRSFVGVAECANSGCTMYGSPETNFLCSVCFRSQQREASRLSDGKVEAAVPCRTKGCTFFGQSATQGFCSKCAILRPTCTSRGCPNKVADNVGRLCEECMAKISSAAAGVKRTSQTQAMRPSAITRV